ncbi:MAG TPA: hypothetical protein VGZ22_28775 [Isosphaeraceae bacterium]|jgi:hypothetical protein|nr:hypothetical protein [Isosphaeraceae bacterium]
MILACELCGENFVADSSPAGYRGRCPSCRGATSRPLVSATTTAVLAPPQALPPAVPASTRVAATTIPVLTQTPRRVSRRRAGELIAALLVAFTLTTALWLSLRPASANVNADSFARVASHELSFDVALRSPLAPWRLTRVEEGELEGVTHPASAPDDIIARTLETVPRAHVAGLNANTADAALSMVLVPIGGPQGLNSSTLGLAPIGAGGGGLGKATFMGITAVGQRFCIIADRSGSMAGAKLEFVKAEILKTLGDLKSGSKFYIIFYNHVADPVPVNHWLLGHDDAVKVSRWMNEIGPEGNTNPLPAFQIAFNLNPRPDVIFFMTDGLFPAEVGPIVAAMNNGRKKIPIHTISFVDRSAEFLLKQIADDSRGTYRHVDHP